ncbi:MAG: HlyD family efflux transporter periplasmic adaptor subunit [Thermoanaerobaculia bacterium]|nr:HlyD family efflux transporter periplasmic adaptor subunit [Thermoanaerobaculia bacterium]
MSRLRRRTIAVALIAVLAVAIAWLLRPKAAAVEIGRVTRGALEVAIEDEGQTRIHPRYVVAAPVAGHLGQLELDPGDVVVAGAVVARLAPAPLDPRSRAEASGRVSSALAAVRAAEAFIAEADAAAAQARSTLVRYRALADAGQLSAEELDRATTEEKRLTQALDGARERAVAARFEVAIARGALLDADSGATILVRAPVGGEVLRLLEDSERVVPAGTPILELGNRADLELVVEVLSTDAVGIPVGAAMSVDAGIGHRIAGRVREIEPAGFTKVSPLGVEEQRVRVIGEPDPAGEQGEAGIAGVGDRFRIRARIVLWRGEAVLQAPSGAVFRSGEHDESWAAYRLDSGRARLVPVEIGHRGADAVEILSGLEEGAPLLLYPGERIRDGSRVRPLGPPGAPREP